MPKPRKRPPFKIGVFSRGRALVHLSRGRTIDETVKLLQKRHPTHSFEDVKRVYFPQRGISASSPMEGKTRSEISKKYSQIRKYTAAQGERGKEMMRKMNANPEFAAKHSARAKKRMREMHEDPEFATKHSARMRERTANPEFAAANSARMRKMHEDPEFAAKHSARMRKMHEDPEFAAKHSARMRKMHEDPEFATKHSARMRERNKDPEFRRKRLEGLARYWNTYRLKIADYLEEMQIESVWQYVGRDESKKVVATKKNPEKTYLQKEKVDTIKQALDSLSKKEGNIVDLVFGFSDIPVSFNDAALILNIKSKSAERIFKSALRKLAKNKKLRDLR